MSYSRGTGSSIFNFIHFIGFALGPTLATIYLLYGMDMIWLLTAVVLSMGILCSILLRLPQESTVSTKRTPPPSTVRSETETRVNLKWTILSPGDTGTEKLFAKR